MERVVGGCDRGAAASATPTDSVNTQTIELTPACTRERVLLHFIVYILIEYVGGWRALSVPFKVRRILLVQRNSRTLLPLHVLHMQYHIMYSSNNIYIFHDHNDEKILRRIDAAASNRGLARLLRVPTEKGLRLCGRPRHTLGQNLGM